MVSWVTVIWSMVAASCFTLAAVHAFVWSRGRSHRAHAVFSLLSLSLGAFALVELAMMFAADAGDYLQLHRAGHVAIFFVVTMIALFVRTYFGVGRLWLLTTVVILRAAIVVLAFVPGPTFNYRHIDVFESVSLLGERVASIQGPASPWARLGEVSILMLLVFVVDASWRAFHTSDRVRRKSVVVIGSSVFLCIGVSILYSFLIHTGRFDGPYILSLSFLFIVAAMARELAIDTVRAARLAGELAEQTRSLTLAARAANLVLWRWDMARDSIWASAEGRELYGIPPDETLDLDRFFEAVHPDDREPTRRAIAAAAADGGEFQTSYRILLPEGAERWIAARGRVEFDSHGKPVCMRGVSQDVSERLRDQKEILGLRDNLAHADRVTLLGQLSTALAHELAQPLGAILRNSEAAGLMLETDTPDLAELREILHDIHADDQRAGEVIDRLRSLLQHRHLKLQPISADSLVKEAVSLVRFDAAAKGVTLASSIPDTLPPVLGDRVHLLQVMLNLLVNAIDAVTRSGTPGGKVSISASNGNAHLEFRVSDTGTGLPEGGLEHLFKPFFTTKTDGMGIGLAVCRTIVETHGGEIDARNHAGGGAEFRFTLPVQAGPSHDSDGPSGG